MRERPRQLGEKREMSIGGTALFALLAALVAVQGVPDRPPFELEALIERIPPRPEGAPAGSEFIRSVGGMTLARREAEIYRQLAGGNIPGFLRRLRPVTLEAEVPGLGIITAVVWVMPDYLAIGSDEDFVRMPMSYYTATALCREWGFLLPTRRMVNAIYRQADVRLAPSPMSPGPRMTSSEYYLRHDRAIARQLAGRGGPDMLVAGHKKDLVLTNRLWSRRARVAIYGWHRGAEEVIQPLSTVHAGTYADYSHGVRLVSERVLVEGRELSLVEVLQDADLARILTAEGVLRDVEGLLELPRPRG